MPKDPICGMEVDERKAIRAEKDGLAYYFCSESCQKKFEKEPMKYMDKK